MPISSDLVAAVENLAERAARIAQSPIPRKVEMAELASQWRAIQDQLPSVKRVMDSRW